MIFVAREPEPVLVPVEVYPECQADDGGAFSLFLVGVAGGLVAFSLGYLGGLKAGEEAIVSDALTPNRRKRKRR
jgi:hypothetical protein